MLGGGGGRLTIDRPASTTWMLTGNNNVVVGRNDGGDNFSGVVILADANDFTGTLTVNRGSELIGLAQPTGGGSPFGSSSNIVYLNGGILVVSNTIATARETVQKGDVIFTGNAWVGVSGPSGGRVTFNPNRFIRSGTSAVIFSGLSQTPSATTDRIILSDSSGLSPNSVGYLLP